MWCKSCSKEIYSDICNVCNNPAQADIPTEVYWCKTCKTPVIIYANNKQNAKCTLCSNDIQYLSADLRPVFPEERILFEAMTGNSLGIYRNASVWAYENRYYVDGNTTIIPSKLYKSLSQENFVKLLEKYEVHDDYQNFLEHIGRFITANNYRYNYLTTEAFSFIQETAKDFPRENITISFSGGKDSTVTSDLSIRALSDPSLVHIFGDTTLEFPSTINYAQRYRKDNPKSIFKTAKNEDQDFYEVCKDIGPPARMLRWCCSMFKTGPITRTINSLYGSQRMLSFYGIRKYESVSRSKYNRVEDNPEAVKIQQQTVASPVFAWRDLDIWLYILTTGIDFNDAYRYGYDRVGCWCCPNNNQRAQFLSSIYMPDESTKWRDFLVDFAKSIGKEDAEIYVDTGKWKARQGGNGVPAASDVKIHFTNCTVEEHAMIYQLNKPIDETFYELFYPLGKIAPSLGRKMINETVLVDIKTNIPIVSIQPFIADSYEHSVKIQTMNIKDHDNLKRMISYQIRKYNACRKCLKCESLCPYGAIIICADEYHIDDLKCKRCKRCVSPKYLAGGCLMDKYLKTKESLVKI